MNWYVFRSPRKKGDSPLEKLTYEPPQIIIEQRAMKYGSIVIVSEEELEKEKNI